MKKIFFLLISVLVSWQAAAQSIIGQIVDEDKEPIPGVNLYLKNDLLNGTISSATGNFELKSASLEDTLIASFMGYQKLEIPLSNNNSPLFIILKSGKEEMKEIVIEGQRLVAEGFDQQKINKMDIYKNPAAKADPLLAVNTLPAATNLDESASVRLRGGLPQETAIFFDGVPVYDAIRYGQLNGIGTFSIFNTAIVNEVRVFPGAAPLEYGSNTSGLVAISSENQLQTDSYTDVLLSMASIGVNHRRKINENTGFRFFSNYQPSAILTGLNSEALQNLKSFNSFDAGLQLVAATNNNWQMKLFNYTNDEGYTFELKEAGEKNKVRQEKLRNFTIFNMSKTVNNTKISLNQGFSFSNQQFNYKRSAVEVGRQSSFSSVSVHRIGKNSEWKAGLNLDLQFQNFSSLSYEVNYATSENDPMVSIEESSGLNRLELYIYRKRNFGDRFMVGSGLSINQRGKLGSNIMANYKISDNHSIRLTESTARRKFMADQYIYFDYEIKADNLALEYIFQNKNQETSVSGYWFRKEYGGDEVKATGLELYQQISFSAIEFNWSFSMLNYYEGIQQHAALKDELVDLDYFFRAAANWTIFAGLELGMNAIYRQGGAYFPVINSRFDRQYQTYEPIMDPSTARLSDYFTFNLNLSKTFALYNRWPLIAFVSLNNVLNHENVSGYQYNFNYKLRNKQLFSQRVFYAGVNIVFGND
jgi:hypothetical protein